MSPGELCVNRSSSSFWDIFKSCGTSYAMSMASSWLTPGAGASAARCAEDVVGRLLGDHADRAHWKEPWDPGEHRGVDHAQPSRAVHAKVGGQDAALVARPDRARTRGVMTPGVGADEVAELGVRPHVLARHLLLGDEPRPPEIGVDAADDLDAGDDRVEVLPRRVAALVEVAKVDVRRLPRVGGAERHLARPVAGVRLEDCPRQVV